MEEYNGVFRIPCTVNGAKMKFIFDTGASSVCLSMAMAEYLYDNGYLDENDIIGSGSSSVADGRIVNHVEINIKDIEINGTHLYNVRAVVVEGQNAPLLMGQSAIQQLGAIEINGNMLTIKNGGQMDENKIDKLFQEAFQASDDQLYGVAIEKYSQLYALGRLSDYGKYLFAEAYYLNEEPLKAEQILKTIEDYSYFRKNQVDIYRLYAHVCISLEKYNDAISYFELSCQRIQKEKEKWLWNLRKIADCYFIMDNYSEAANYYRITANIFAEIHNVDIAYLQRDSKNRLKKKEKSYRCDEIDYVLYRLFLSNERSGAWSTDGFLLEVAAMARAGNKYATKLFNDAGLDPNSEAFR